MAPENDTQPIVETNKTGTVFLRYAGKQKYLSEDPGDKKLGIDRSSLSALPGDVVEVTEHKARQLKKDYPLEWKDSSKAEWDKSERERMKRTEEAARLAEKQHEASIEREKKAKLRRARSSQSASDEEDDELEEN